MKLILEAEEGATARAAVGLASLTTVKTAANGLVLHLGNNNRVSGVTTTHLAAHLLEELARLLAGHELELVTTTASDWGRVTGRTVDGDKSFGGSHT